MNNAVGRSVFFDLYSGGKKVGPGISGVAQESLTNWFVLGTKNPDSSWVPALGTNDMRYTIADVDGFAAIVDFKYVSPVPTVPFVGTIITYTQENRFVWTDFCGVQRTCSLGTVNFTFTGTAKPSYSFRAK